MKNSIITAIVVATAAISACTSNNNKTSEQKSETEVSANEQMYACSMHPEETGKKGDKCSKCGMELTEPVKNEPSKVETTPITVVDEKTTEVATVSFSIDAMVTNYISLKNALTKDDSKTAASAAKALYANFNAVNANAIDAKLQKEFIDIAESAKEHAEHIGANAAKIDHQREHFATLSKDMNDMIKIFGTKQKLYQDFCPMYNDGKGAIWISEFKEIKNPFYGSKMLSCGSMKKAL